MKQHELDARRAAIATELRQLDPTADAAEARMADLERELAQIDTRAKHLAMLDAIDATSDAKPAERRVTVGSDGFLAPEQRMASFIEARTGQPTEGLSAGRMIRGLVFGRWDGAEA
jgi:hypothetical protein